MNNIIEITSVTAWRKLLEESESDPVLLLKHSTRCPVSTSAFQAFNTYCAEQGPELKCCLVKVIESREVSNAIAQDTGVPHQSPQIHLISDGKSIWNDSHRNITAEKIEQALQACLPVKK